MPALRLVPLALRFMEREEVVRQFHYPPTRREAPSGTTRRDLHIYIGGIAEMADCEHPDSARGYWAHGRRKQGSPNHVSEYPFGWVCADCGKVEQVGLAPSMLHWMKVKPFGAGAGL